VSFPTDYWDAKLAGKPARFQISVLTVEGPELAELNDAFADKVGIKEGGLEKLKERIKEGLANEATHLLQQDLKQQVLDQLLAANTVDVPQSLIKTELDMLNRNPGAAKLDDKQSLEDNAKKRVALSLILGQYIKQEGIALDQEKVQMAVRQMAMNYPDPQAVIKWFYQDYQRLSGVASMVLEDQAVEKLLEAVKTSDKKLSYKEIVKKTNG
jgi:trigger factor